MYHQNSTTESTTIRIFSPIILFHADDNNTNISNDQRSQMIELKKQKINAMLKSNGQFWSNVISSSRSQMLSSPPQTPPPTKYYHTLSSFYSSSCSSSCTGDEEEDVDIEEDEGEEEEDEESNTMIPLPTSTTKTTGTKKKMIKSTNGRKRRGNLPKNVTAILKQWLVDHRKHPYPSEEEKQAIKNETDLTLNQISNWFINARRRILPFILQGGEVEESAAAKKGSSVSSSSSSKKRKNSSSSLAEEDNKKVSLKRARHLEVE